MIETYKIVTGIWGVDKEIYFKQATNSITRGHCYKQRKQRAKNISKSEQILQQGY